MKRSTSSSAGGGSRSAVRCSRGLGRIGRSTEQAGWRIEPTACRCVVTPRRVSGASSSCRQLTLALLSVGARSGQEFGLFTAATLAQQTSAAITAVDRATTYRLGQGPGQSLCFHPRQVARNAARSPEAEVRPVASAAARSGTRKAAARLRLAYHFDAAGENGAPFGRGPKASLRTQHSLELAEQQYRIAMRRQLRSRHATGSPKAWATC